MIVDDLPFSIADDEGTRRAHCHDYYKNRACLSWAWIEVGDHLEYKSISLCLSYLTGNKAYTRIFKINGPLTLDRLFECVCLSWTCAVEDCLWDVPLAHVHSHDAILSLYEDPAGQFNVVIGVE